MAKKKESLLSQDWTLDNRGDIKTKDGQLIIQLSDIGGCGLSYDEATEISRAIAKLPRLMHAVRAYLLNDQPICDDYSMSIRMVLQDVACNILPNLSGEMEDAGLR